MVTKLTYGSGLGEGLSSFGASIGKALEQVGLRRQQAQQQKAGANILGQVLDNPELINIASQLPLDFQKQLITEVLKGQTESRKAQISEHLSLQKEKIKSEYEAPDIKKYRENLGMREETATQLAPALTNARQFAGDSSRFIKGTRASKALGDLATRAFAFYKPLFGGRLTQKEFERSITNLSADRTFPGGYDQALNLIESMITQATNEAESFNKYLDQGLSPFQSRRKTLSDMRGNADEIIKILQGKRAEASQTKETKENEGIIEGKIYVNPKSGQRIQWSKNKWRTI